MATFPRSFFFILNRSNQSMLIFAGIRGKVEVDDKQKQGWKIYPLEFRKYFVSE